MSRNLVAPETAERNRREGAGGYTFNVHLPEDLEGDALGLGAVRIGDHAHVLVYSGRATPDKPGYPARPPGGYAGKLILRWPEWELLRDLLAASERVRIGEVERPTQAMAERHAGVRPEGGR